MYIKSVSLKLDGTLLNAEILFEGQAKLEFAFYVFKNGKRIHTQWYIEKNTFVFDTNGEPGYYNVCGFCKDGVGGSDSKNSVPILAHQKIVRDRFKSVADISEAMIVEAEGWAIPMLYYPSTEKTLFVLMPSAVNRSCQTLPVFSRFTWAGKGVFNGHVLCVADPTLSLNDQLALGWFLGSRHSNLSEIFGTLVSNLANALDIPNNKIVFWGSSAGGFSSLAISARIRDSTAVAINSQTDALLYEQKKQVDLVKKYIFDDLPDNIIRGEMADRISMIELIKKSNSRSVMIQNKRDHHHYNVHFCPYWLNIGGDILDGWSNSGEHLAFVYEDPRGHVAETEEMVAQIIEKIFCNSL